MNRGGGGGVQGGVGISSELDVSRDMDLDLNQHHQRDQLLLSHGQKEQKYPDESLPSQGVGGGEGGSIINSNNNDNNNDSNNNNDVTSFLVVEDLNPDDMRGSFINIGSGRGILPPLHPPVPQKESHNTSLTDQPFPAGGGDKMTGGGGGVDQTSGNALGPGLSVDRPAAPGQGLDEEHSVETTPLTISTTTKGPEVKSFLHMVYSQRSQHDSQPPPSNQNDESQRTPSAQTSQNHFSLDPLHMMAGMTSIGQDAFSSISHHAQHVAHDLSTVTHHRLSTVTNLVTHDLSSMVSNHAHDLSDLLANKMQQISSTYGGKNSVEASARALQRWAFVREVSSLPL